MGKKEEVEGNMEPGGRDGLGRRLRSGPTCQPLSAPAAYMHMTNQTLLSTMRTIDVAKTMIETMNMIMV